MIENINSEEVKNQFKNETERIEYILNQSDIDIKESKGSERGYSIEIDSDINISDEMINKINEVIIDDIDIIEESDSQYILWT